MIKKRRTSSYKIKSMMKKYKQCVSFTLIGLLLTGLSGCALEETPFSQIYTDNYYKNAAEVESAHVAMYGSFYDLYGGHYPLLAETASDLMFPRNVVGRASITLYTYEPTYSVQTGFARVFESPIQLWQSAYQCIEKANWLLEKVPNTEMDTVRRREVIGEAYFLRALMHWTLAKNFGEVPLKVTPTNTIERATNAKAPLTEIYTLIYDDLTKATAALPNYSAGLVPGRACKQAAILLHAKAALYNENWALAFAKSKELIDSGRLTLLPNVVDVYDVTKKSQARTENIFAAESNGLVTPNKYTAVAWQVAPQTGVGVYSNGASGGFYMYRSFYKSFNPIDKRRLLLDTSFVSSSGTVVRQNAIDTRLLAKDSLVVLGKFKDPKSVGAANSNNMPVLRYADAFLIAAEAEARQNGGTGVAYDYINVIRRRAGIPALTPGLSKDGFIDAVLRERAWEFFGEGDRWYDLTRTGKFLTEIPKVKNADYPERKPLAKHKYFPIPQVEINANPKLQQNPDWQ
ncbi:RagB/SusD family nutrient uptake outer membrane protein [Spirosoma daeguense]